MKIGLVGTPNIGKTMLFNRMTACQACVGNWAGVTSSCAEAGLCGTKKSIQLIDLPGCYSLPSGPGQEEIQSHADVYKLIQDKQIDLVVNVIDVTDLPSQLYLSLQLLDTGMPMIVALNRVDCLANHTHGVDIDKLSSILGVPCHGISAKTGWGVQALVQSFEEDITHLRDVLDTRPVLVRYPAIIEQNITDHQSKTGSSRYDAICSCLSQTQAKHAPAFLFAKTAGVMLTEKPWGPAELIAQHRHQVIESISSSVRKAQSQSQKSSYTRLLDRYFLHKWLGLPIFFMLMFMVFWLSIGVGQFLQMLLEPFWRLIALDMPALALAYVGAPTWLYIILTQGVGVSLVTAGSFIPVLLCMFTALHFLEESGYMTRAALVIDRLMRFLDLPGESMVALVLGLGCNVPGVLATRHIPKEADRILTTMMMPFMSCSARLTIFAVFVSAFFQKHAAGVLCFLYLLGFCVACLTGVLLRWVGWIPSPTEDTHLLQLPDYQTPGFTKALWAAGRRSWQFITRALQVIFPVCVILALLNHVSLGGYILIGPTQDSILAAFGKGVAWLFYPIGLSEQQWPLIVALFTGLLAKEVVITTMGVFFAEEVIMQPLEWYSSQSIHSIWQSCYQAFIESQMEWGASLFSLPTTSTGSALTPYLQASFPSNDHVISYLIFILLYFPCVSTLYATTRQVGWRWARFSLLWSCAIAYLAASSYLLITVHLPWLKTLCIAWIVVYLGYGICRLTVRIVIELAQKRKASRFAP